MTKAADEFLQQCNASDLFPDIFEFLESKSGLSDREQIDALLVDQYQRWKTNQVIPVDEYLARTPEISDLLKVDLLLEEYGYLDQRGIAPPPIEFAKRYLSLSEEAKQEFCDGLGIEFIGSDNESEYTKATDETKRDSKSMPKFIGRYRIIRMLGKGAFGKVFLAKDPDLDRTVAIKVPTNKRIQMGGGTEEFLNEARAVAKLEHTNIVPVFDCGIAEDDRCFVVSKYIRGKELRAEIRKGLDHQESASIIGSLARALHVAHVGGVVHRDVKPGNVIIDSNRQPHLLDFGLALREGDSLEGETLVGTPAYMSPEQADGGSRRIDGRSDIYSLAVIFYEMLTGHRPYKGDNAEELIAQLKHGEVRPPRQSDDSIPVELEQICLKALSRKLTDRYNTAKDMADDIEQWLIESSTEDYSLGSLDSHRSWSSRKQVPPTYEPLGFSRWLRSPATIAIGVGAIALVAIMAFTNPPWERSSEDTRKPDPGNKVVTSSAGPIEHPPLATIENPARIGVLGFRNLTNDSSNDWMSVGFAELVVEELEKSNEFGLVAGEDIATTKLDLDLADSDSISASTLKRIKNRLGIDWVMFGSWSHEGDHDEKTRLSVEVRHTSNEYHQFQFSNIGRSDDWMDLCSRTGAKIRKEFNVSAPNISGSGELFLAAPIQAASKDYFEGIAFLRRFQANAAANSLKAALIHEPEAALIHDSLSQALRLIGNETDARMHAAKAVEFCGSLADYQKLAIKARHNLLIGKPDEAAKEYRKLATQREGNTDAQLKLASALVAAGQGREALALLEDANVTSLSIPSKMQLDLAASEAAQSISDFPEQVRLAQIAKQTANDIGARLLEAQANLVEGEGHRRLSQHEEASLCFERAVKLFREHNDQLNEILALSAWGKALIDHGQLELAESKIDGAMAISESINNDRLIAKANGLRGEVAIFRGKFDRAIELLESSLGTFTTLGDWQGVAGVNLTLANVLARTGKLNEALKMVASAREAFQASGNRLAEARTWGQEGAMRARTGDSIEAQRYFERALELFREVGDERSVAICLGDLASTNSNLGRLTKAGELYSEALEMHRQIGSKRGPEMVMFNLSNLYARTGRFEEAYDLMHKSYKRFAEMERWMNAVFVQRKLADIQLKRGDLKLAKATLTSTMAKSKEVNSLATQAQTFYSQHQVALFEGDRDEAVEQLIASKEISEQLKQEISAAMCDFSIARVLFRDEPERALKLLDASHTKLVSLQPELKPTLHYARCQAESFAGNADAASLSFSAGEEARGSSSTEDLGIQLMHQHERALALRALKRVNESIHELDEVSRLAEKYGWKSLEWEAAIQRFELQADSSTLTETTAITKLASEVKGKGFVDFEKRIAAIHDPD